MFKDVDGKKIPLTQEEIQKLEADRKKYEEELKNQPPTVEERLELTEQAVQDLILSTMKGGDV